MGPICLDAKVKDSRAWLGVLQLSIVLAKLWEEEDDDEEDDDKETCIDKVGEFLV